MFKRTFLYFGAGFVSIILILTTQKALAMADCPWSDGRKTGLGIKSYNGNHKNGGNKPIMYKWSP